MPLKISALMAVYNGESYLRQAVESILDQTFRDFEFIIIDDGSSDSTWEIITEYAERDQRIMLVQNKENIGLTKSLNKGLALAQGEYVARQDADDVSLPKRFEKQVTLLNKHPEVVLASCDIEVITSEGCPVEKYQRACDSDLVAWYLLFHNRLAGHSQVMFRRKSAINLGGYSETYRCSQDYELWCRLVKVGKIAILPEVLLQQRIHSRSISAEKKLEQEAYTLIQVRHNIGQLVGEEIRLEEAKDLRGFWIGHWWSGCFPDSRRVGALHSRLKAIHRMFLQQGTQQNCSDSNMSRRLRILIGQQFICWIQALSVRHRLLSKMNISLYAFAWYPLGVLDYWLREFWNVLLRMLRALVRLHHKQTFKATS